MIRFNTVTTPRNTPHEYALKCNREKAHLDFNRYMGSREADTKLIRFGARDYDPTIGRWTTPDPAGFIDDLNRYAYVRGNPMSLTDPTGNCPWCVGAIVGGVVSGVSTYLAGGTSEQIGASILVGVATGAATWGASAFYSSATGVAISNAAIGVAGNAALQMANGTSVRDLNGRSLAFSGFAGGAGGLIGLGAGNAAFFRTPVIGNQVGNAAARTRELWASTLIGTAAGTAIETGLMCK